MSRGKPCTASIMEIISISAMKAMWQLTRAIVHVKSQPSELRLIHVHVADNTPSSASFNASNSVIQLQKISKAKPSICEFKPNKVQKVEVCFIPRLLLPELICIHASLLWLWCRENWTKLGEKRKKEGENMVRIMRELLGLKWVPPPCAGCSCLRLIPPNTRGVQICFASLWRESHSR